MIDQGKQQTQQFIPTSDIDLQFLTTEPEWGKRGVSAELVERLKRIEDVEPVYDEATGALTGYNYTTESLWGLLSFYTRDFRLANLSTLYGETKYCQYMIDLAADCLREGYISSFLTALSRAVTVLELSQSKGGFLRKRQGTFTAENVSRSDDPPKKGLFGKKKQEGR